MGGVSFRTDAKHHAVLAAEISSNNNNNNNNNNNKMHMQIIHIDYKFCNV